MVSCERFKVGSPEMFRNVADSLQSATFFLQNATVFLQDARVSLQVFSVRSSEFSISKNQGGDCEMLPNQIQSQLHLNTFCLQDPRPIAAA